MGPPRKVAEEDDPRLRWAFVRKVYCILALQCALTAGISAAACFVRPVPRFFEHGPPAARWPVVIAMTSSHPSSYRAKHPVNLLLLVLFTLCCSLMMAFAVSTTLGKVVLQAAVLTTAAVISLTIFTFWAAMKGLDFTFLPAFLSTSLDVLLVYLLIQVYVPLGTVGITVFGYIGTLIFSGYIIYDTSLLLKRYTYDEYVIAAISLYLDIINLFMAQISLSSQ
ncbi:hypothetical protein PR202_ga22073 [Eleusine coracana subsp. coracana]|uniref:Transmembrane BAX inhibitor motif-containing protein 4 n=1 Tax=Eleusine coracana subsp. coracana TaxID=191504 RepID=A0AAV5D2M9_ELECO|nr:hypothetical protein PR202_ga22073 [Eleusine coracana subsp. coracana]